MNNQVLLLRNLEENPAITQRKLAAALDVSLGTANKLLSEALESGLLMKTGGALQLTEAGHAFLEPYRVDSAVILAAGFGSRFVPLTWETPKGLLPVLGERMIERQIRQLQEAGIFHIYLCVGYLKEKFEYLIDKFGVQLIFNPEYDRKNTISTLHTVKDIMTGHNCYLCNSDNWLRENLYHRYEPDSWYSSAYAEGPTGEWCLSFNKKLLITGCSIGGRDSWVMYGPAYFSKDFSQAFFPRLEAYYHTPGSEDKYWEHVYLEWLGKKDCPPLYINRQPADTVYEFENLEELRAFDHSYLKSSDNEAMARIARALHCEEAEIQKIRNVKAGMTNRSFRFTVRGKDYICRVPGEGTALLINRKHEYENILAVQNLGITEAIVSYDPETGYKISEYYPDARTADIHSPEDMKRCMRLIHQLHEFGITVNHDFDLEERLNFYEGLCMTHGGIPYEDYTAVREKSRRTLAWLRTLQRPRTLCHVDACVDNMLFLRNDQELKLIDWEYAGMADPLLDVAMCAIYSYQTPEQAYTLASYYFGREADATEKQILRAYMSLGGLLWALWAVYKQSLGVSFGEYTLIMYRYGKLE